MTQISDVEGQKIIAKHQQGKTIQDIAYIFSRSPKTISDYLDMKGIRKKKPKLVGDDHEGILKLFEKGKTPAEIAPMVNRVEQTVIRILKKHGKI